MSFFTQLRDTVTSVGAAAVQSVTGLNVQAALPVSAGGTPSRNAAPVTYQANPQNPPPQAVGAGAFMSNLTASPNFMPLVMLGAGVVGIILVVRLTK